MIYDHEVVRESAVLPPIKVVRVIVTMTAAEAAALQGEEEGAVKTLLHTVREAIGRALCTSP